MKTIKFNIEPRCSKCGGYFMNWNFYRRGPMSDAEPDEFIVLKCNRCNYSFEMYTKDYMEEKDD